MEELPWMGLGLSTNLGPRDRPDPWRLHDARPDLFDFVEYSAPLSLEAARASAARMEVLLARRDDLPAIFHPVHLNLWGPELEPAADLAALRDHLRAVGSPWVGNDVGWWHRRGVPFPGHLYVAPPFDTRGVEQCAAHAAHVQAAIDVPLLLENPAVLHRDGGMHVLDFLAALHARTGCGILLDLGHLLAWQLVHGLPPTAGLDGFPLEGVVEIHVAGGVVTERDGRRFYLDDHALPVRDEVFELLDALLPRCTGLRALTFEADGHPEHVAAATLERLRRAIPPRDVGDPAGARAAARPSAAAAHAIPPSAEDREATAAREAPGDAAADAWARFERVHGIAPGPDPVGLAVEADYRVAVIAWHLDRDWPLTRAICAGDRAALGRFVASEAYRSLFDGTGWDLAGAFAAWARAEVRGGAPPGADVALAFESFCHGLLARAAAAAPPPGAIALAPGVAAGTFPVDLDELLWAARALRRHLGDRAAATGRHEGSGAEALARVAARAPRRPWPVLVRRVAGALEARRIDPELLRLLRAAGAGAAPDALDPPAREVLERAIAAGILRIA